jgi:Asp-tRNA(Asn)/Glu-tRNA(Gln) amidotransferase A subunit family amidase
MSFAIEEVTIAQLHAAYQAGEATALSVVRGYLHRIDAYDRRGPYLNSLIHVNASAFAEADRLDASLQATAL